ncbi:MAG: inositol monophosphatase, partial [Gemmatimonadota bacterium]|nr:inositol monophosphatase [Gemmatimonadota bacterium]
SATPWAAEAWLARRAAADAAALLLAGRSADDLREKGPRDLVTSVDEAAERLIVQRIRTAFPDDAIVAEEGGESGEDAARRWIIDPIDGTTNFVHGHPFACVSIAFADAKGPAVGFIHAPFLREVYHAVRGEGAFLNDRPIRVSGVREPGRALLATGFPFKKGKGNPEAYLRILADALQETHGVRRAGSAALDLAYVAAGRVDGFWETGLAPWDVAAGMLLVAEAGGRVGGWPGDEPPPLASGRVLASNGALHGWMEELVGRHAAEL